MTWPLSAFLTSLSDSSLLLFGPMAKAFLSLPPQPSPVSGWLQASSLLKVFKYSLPGVSLYLCPKFPHTFIALVKCHFFRETSIPPTKLGPVWIFYNCSLFTVCVYLYTFNSFFLISMKLWEAIVSILISAAFPRATSVITEWNYENYVQEVGMCPKILAFSKWSLDYFVSTSFKKIN